MNETTNEGPEHVNRLNSIAKLTAEGFQGPDASLAESIFEYGIAWKEYSEFNGQLKGVIFVHRSSHGRNFDRTSFAADLDVQKEFNWVNWQGFMGYLGVKDLNEWLQFSLQHKINDLVGFWGVEEIFGTTYWEGFTISE